METGKTYVAGSGLKAEIDELCDDESHFWLFKLIFQ